VYEDENGRGTAYCLVPGRSIRDLDDYPGDGNGFGDDMSSVKPPTTKSCSGFTTL
jgi:hypothetical protein